MKKALVIIAVVLALNCSVFADSSEMDPFTDSRDGKIYKTLRIGDQVWMAENLAYKVDNGCWFFDEEHTFIEKNGYLYSWETAQDVIPEGWKLPNKEDFETLLSNLGGKGENAFIPLILDFSAVLTGFRGEYGILQYEGSVSNYWSSTEISSTEVWRMMFNGLTKEGDVLEADKGSFGFSIRCIRDEDYNSYLDEDAADKVQIELDKDKVIEILSAANFCENITEIVRNMPTYFENAKGEYCGTGGGFGNASKPAWETTINFDGTNGKGKITKSEYVNAHYCSFSLIESSSKTDITEVFYAFNDRVQQCFPSNSAASWETDSEDLLYSSLINEDGTNKYTIYLSLWEDDDTGVYGLELGFSVRKK